MSLKIHILLLLSLFYWQSNGYASEKFLKIKGEVVDVKGEAITNYTIKKVEDELDSNRIECSKSKFKIWVSANRETKLYFIKDGFVIKHIFIDAGFIPSRAYKKKQKVKLNMVMNKSTKKVKRIDKAVKKIVYDPMSNKMLVKDMTKEIDFEVEKEYKPPFPAPVDAFADAKPSTRKLNLTTTFPQNKAEGNSEEASILQGILFADMNHSLFSERTNDANNYLALLKSANNDEWGNVKAFDSPEYGKIVMRTLNREKSIDTMFALGAHLETSRLICQNFTSDSKVLIHFKLLVEVLNQYHPEMTSSIQKNFLKDLNDLIPHINKLEDRYKEQLRNKMNFEMQEDEEFKVIQKKINTIYRDITAKT